MFPHVPILGLTATASDSVLNDLKRKLDIREAVVFKIRSIRPNLYYHVMSKPSSLEGVINLLESLLNNRYVGMSGIIFVSSIKDCADVTDQLLSKNIKVMQYHEDQEADARKTAYKKWKKNKIQALVTTNEMGLGLGMYSISIDVEC